MVIMSWALINETGTAWGLKGSDITTQNINYFLLQLFPALKHFQ
jgi:hypothetical protein